MGLKLSHVRAGVARSMFILMVCFTVWHLTIVTHVPIWWLLCIGFLLLLVEFIIIMAKRHGHELKWLCVSVLFFIMTEVPAIWVLEIGLLNDFREQLNSTSTTDDEESTTMRHMFATPTAAAYNWSTINGTDLTGPTTESHAMDSVAELFDDIADALAGTMTEEEWILVIEQAFLFVLIIGRWIMPCRSISTDAHSQLILVFIGVASDIMDFLVLFDTSAVLKDTHMPYAILSIWTLSICQFCFVLTATRKKRPDDAISEGSCDLSCFETEIWSVVLMFLMQDLPFLVVRLYVLINWNIVNYSILFYTFKNGLILMLTCYRICTLGGQVRKERRRRMKILLEKHTDMWVSTDTVASSENAGDDNPGYAESATQCDAQVIRQNAVRRRNGNASKHDERPVSISQMDTLPIHRGLQGKSNAYQTNSFEEPTTATENNAAENDTRDENTNIDDKANDNETVVQIDTSENDEILGNISESVSSASRISNEGGVAAKVGSPDRTSTA